MEVFKNKKVIILMIIILICSFTYVYAKYLSNYKENSLYVAEDFYFNSDLLTKEGLTYKYQKGVNNISVILKNNEDDLRYSESDIDYEIKIVDVSGESVISNTSEEIKNITGILKGGKINNETITFSNLATGTYKVEATTKTPYVTTLKATFVITEKDNNINYEISDSKGSTVLFLTISSTDYNGKVNITIPDGLLPDNTIKAFNNVNIDNNSKIQLDFEENSSYTYKFFKENPNSLYSESDFLIEGE